jgi:integrase
MTDLPQRAVLSDAFIDDLPTADGVEHRIWDKTISGLCLRIHPSGRRVFCLKFRVDGKPIWKTLGAYGRPWTTEQARKAATQILAAKPLYSRLHGPTALHALEQISNAAGTAQSSITVTELIDQYLEKGPATNPAKRASSWDTDRGNLRRHVQPLIGYKHLHEVTVDDVSLMCISIRDGKTATRVRTSKRGFARVTGGGGAAAIALRTLKTMFNWAIARELMEKNPTCRVRLPKRVFRERILTREEASRLLATIARLESEGAMNVHHGDIVRLLLLTGARRSEIMGLRWEEVALERRQLILPPERSKTGGKTGERRIALSPGAAKILQRRTPEGKYVFPALRGKDGHTTGLYKSWYLMRSEAGLGRLRLHDLRHSFASFALESGENILAISAALGHASTQMTERYLHLRADAAGNVADRTSAFILGEAKPEPRTAEVIPELRISEVTPELRISEVKPEPRTAEEKPEPQRDAPRRPRIRFPDLRSLFPVLGARTS